MKSSAIALFALVLAGCPGDQATGTPCFAHDHCESTACCYQPLEDRRVCESSCTFCRNDDECEGLLGCCLGRCQLGACERPDAGPDAGTPDADSGPPPGVDAGVDGGPPVIEPPADPIPTARRPERPARYGPPFRRLMTPITLDVPAIAIPGDGEVVLHDLVTGAELDRYTTMDTPYATAHLTTDDLDRLVTVGAGGASANTCTDTGVSPFGQLLYPITPPNITDISLIGAPGTATAAILTNNGQGGIVRVYYDSSSPSLLLLDRETSITPTGAGADAVSAEAPVGDSPVLVAVDGSPGALRWVDWLETPPTTVDVGDLGESPRIMGCAPDGAVCFVPNFGNDTVTVVDTSASPPTIRETVDVGAGPISVDVASLSGTNVGVTTGFSDDSLHYLIDDGASVRVVTESLSSCASPGHALLIPELGWTVVTCNADDTYVVRRIPADVP